MSTEMDKLALKRKIPITRLREIHEYGLNSTSDPFYKQNFLARAEFVDIIYEDFQETHNKIISLISSDEDFETQDKYRATADKYFYGIKGKKLELALTDTNTAPPLPNSSGSPATSGAKLPKINVPTFDGNIKLWPSFFDLYNCIIHQNLNLSNVEKFHYLMASLKNDPFNLIKSIPMTDLNYQIAYDTLVGRYQNKRFLATTYFNEIYTARPLQKSSFKELRCLLDVFSENLAALQVLNFDTNSWDFLIFNILLQKLDSKTRTNFELEYSTIDMPTYKDLVSYLTNHCKALESVQCMAPSLSTKSRSFNIPSNNTSVLKSHGPSAYLGTVGNQPRFDVKCVLCSASHALYRCQLFLSKPPHERLSFIKQNKLCGNCLRAQHPRQKCPSSTNCRICHLRHHTTLHLNSKQNSAVNSESTPNTENSNTSFQPPATDSESSSRNKPQSSQTVQCTTCVTSTRHSTILLSTAEVECQDIWGNFQKVRVLFDTGSMANFISEKCVNRLGLKRQRISVPIEGLNNSISTSNNGITQCFIKPRDQIDPTFAFEAIILPKVCSDQPKFPLTSHNWSMLKSLCLADPRFQTPGPIDILLGAELVPLMLGSARIFGKPGQPVALETVFGWILQGRAECSTPGGSLLSGHASIEPPVDITLQKFWEIEQVPSCSNHLSPDDVKCENLYKKLVYREDSGRFVVPLPFRHVEPDFGTSYLQALRRFTYLESRLYKNPDLHKSYSDFIQEFIQQKYVSDVPREDYRSSTAFYLPHHCVLKPESTSTKLRVVFDASAKASKGISLNDSLFSGPKLHQDLSALLLKFRTFPVAFICDIKQMYCQILVRPEHRNFQRFLWRFSNAEEIKEYTLDRVTFGISSAPFLALRTLEELANLEGKNYPLASKVLQSSIYMDDCVSGADSVKAALQLQQELIALLGKGGFELRKWACNNPAILRAVPYADIQMPLSFDTDGPSFIKVLGLQWNPSLDVFSYSCTPTDANCTKRTVLSQIARIFDPLGFLSPTVLLAKHILQQLWLSKKDWDDTPSESIVEIWRRFQSELPQISNIQLPRLLVSRSISRLELHGFCDASTIGYGCVIYFRFITTNGHVKTTLISGKSRVAPLRNSSLPRLELCSATLLADLVAFVKESYDDRLTFDAIYAWSDSQVALSWLSSSPHRWKTFVANRVAHVQDIILPSSWRYVPSEQNPADCVSRGLTPSQLLDHKLWWQGPDFLLKGIDNWPEQPLILTSKLPEASQEERPVVLQVSVQTPSLASELLFKFSSLRKIQRILAYALRFISRTRRFPSNHSSHSETHRALLILVGEVQKKCFSEIILGCKKNSLLPKPFRKLAPFLDEAGILRVGGRLRKSSMPFDAKHPILLPKAHRLTDLIIEQVHQENFHPGLKTLHNLILQNFWIISPRSAIHRCLSKCMKCFRSKPQSYTPVMADLPEFRISQLKAFSQICVDYAGPFTTILGRYRGCKTSKAYICIFVCCATKAIHLELSSDLSSEAFLASFRRFIARRGKVSDIYSDQGTNFKGANNQIINFSKAAAETLSIKWHFNPPGAPHFNGLSEAGVKSVKTHIYRVIGEQRMTYEEFYTLLTQIESLLNSRPLSPISEDPNDLFPLTPGHFLTTEPLSSFPEPDMTPIPLNRLTRWQMLQKMHVDFWKRWSQEYLNTLQQRHKWDKPSLNVRLNSLVLIRNEQTPPLKWALGRVTKLHPGEDGIVRVVTLLTKNGVIQRPVVKICPLPGQ